MLVLVISELAFSEPLVATPLASLLPSIAWTPVPSFEALEAVHDPPAAAVVDTALTWASPRLVLDTLRLRFPRCPVVVLTDTLNEADLSLWLTTGVADYVRRDDLARLPLAIERATERAGLAAQLDALRQDGLSPGDFPSSTTLRSLSDELYQVFISQSTEGIWCFEVADPLPATAPLDEQIAHAYRHAYLIECNDAMARMYGFAHAAELLGARLDQLLDPADPRNEAYLRAFFEQGYRLTDIESYEHDRDGNERVFVNSLIGTVVDQRLVRAWGAQRDITARVRDEREQQLRAATGTLLAEALDYEATLASVARLLVPELADYCLIHTADSAGALRMLIGVHRDPAFQPLLDRLAAIYRPSRKAPASVIGQVFRTGKALLSPDLSLEQVRAVVGDGEVLELYRQLDPRSYIVAPLLARGQVGGTITLARVGERQRFDQRDLALAEELAHRCATALDNATLYREARTALQARDELLTIASHELRTPLTALIGFTSVLQRRNERSTMLNERDTQILDLIAEQGKRLERLIGLVLDQARITDDRLEVEHAPVDLAALVRRAVAQLEPALERHRITLDAGETPLVVECDELRLEQVIQHLLLNAVKYSPRGGPIAVEVRRLQGDARVTIRDEGIGVPADDLPRLGERFFRARNVNLRQISGTGIGLYVVQGILAAHGGTLKIASAEGQGTTVTVRLPLVQQEKRAYAGARD